MDCRRDLRSSQMSHRKAAGRPIRRPSLATTATQRVGVGNDLCTRHNIDPSRTKEAPLPPGMVPTKLEGDPVPDLRTPTQQIVGSLSYLSTTVRADICYATSTLSRVSHSPNKKQCNAALHTVKYLSQRLRQPWSVLETSGSTYSQRPCGLCRCCVC